MGKAQMAIALWRPSVVSAPVIVQAFSMKEVTTHKPLAVLGAGTGALGETIPPCLDLGSSFTSESTVEASQPLAETTCGEETVEPSQGHQCPQPEQAAM